MATQSQTFGVMCDDRSETQQLLNRLYDYEHELLKIYHRARIALFDRLVRSLIAEGVIREFGNALDVGCNRGFYSRLISDYGFRNVLGIDICEEYVGTANREFGSDRPDKRISFLAMDAGDLRGQKTGGFDFILCTEVIEHTDNRDAVITSIMDLLSPNGVAVISLPNAISLGYFTTYVGYLLRRRKISKEIRDHLDFPFYKGPSLFEEKGARVIRTAGVNCLFNSPLISLLHRSPLFQPLNQANFWLSSRTPCKWISQFFFFVIAKKTPSPPTRESPTIGRF